MEEGLLLDWKLRVVGFAYVVGKIELETEWSMVEFMVELSSEVGVKQKDELGFPVSPMFCP